MFSRAASFRDLDHSAMDVRGATADDLDPVEIARLRRSIEGNAGRSDSGLLALSDLDLLKALGLVAGGDAITSVRLAGLLLVGKEASLARLVPTHEVAFQALAGTRAEVNVFTRAPLIRCVEDIEARFDARNRATEVDVGFRRVLVPDVSPTGFREAFLNALVHRDYARKGTVKIQWRADGLEIANPGGFVEGVHAGALLTTGAVPRNQALASAMHRIGLAERLGRGINAIFEGQLRFGRPAPDYSRSNDLAVSVFLPGGSANLAFTRFVLEREADATRPPLTVEDLLTLHVVQRDRRTSAEDVAVVLQRRDEAGARRVLEGLVERGVLVASGDGARRRYLLSPASFTALGLAEDGIRARGFTSVQHREMVLAYAFEHGRIVRSQVAALCQVDSDRAKLILQDLLASNALELHGERRTAYYTLARPERERLSKTLGKIPKRRQTRRKTRP
jgi:ATP-dependent DNA helicase RecG